MFFIGKNNKKKSLHKTQKLRAIPYSEWVDVKHCRTAMHIYLSRGVEETFDVLFSGKIDS